MENMRKVTVGSQQETIEMELMSVLIDTIKKKTASPKQFYS